MSVFKPEVKFHHPGALNLANQTKILGFPQLDIGFAFLEWG
ncbi:hypothetical protein MPB2EB_0204 [Mycoavidus sp. B2-EB]|nr:hypothetical protein MPB2EB_0204 [Mycoavidus sp. B2-EB]